MIFFNQLLSAAPKFSLGGSNGLKVLLFSIVQLASHGRQLKQQASFFTDCYWIFCNKSQVLNDIILHEAILLLAWLRTKIQTWARVIISSDECLYFLIYYLKHYIEWITGSLKYNFAGILPRWTAIQKYYFHFLKVDWLKNKCLQPENENAWSRLCTAGEGHAIEMNVNADGCFLQVL